MCSLAPLIFEEFRKKTRIGSVTDRLLDLGKRKDDGKVFRNNDVKKQLKKKVYRTAGFMTVEIWEFTQQVLLVMTERRFGRWSPYPLIGWLEDSLGKRMVARSDLGQGGMYRSNGQDGCMADMPSVDQQVGEQLLGKGQGDRWLDLARTEQDRVLFFDVRRIVYDPLTQKALVERRE